MATKSSFSIEAFPQLEALASPVRQEIVDAVEAGGPCSIAEIASMLGRPADGLYYHVRKLEEVGLLETGGTRPTDRRDEALYDVPGRPLRMAYDAEDPQNLRALGNTVGAMLRLTQRDFDSALHAEDATFEGRRRNTTAGRVTGWLTARDLAEVNRLLEEIRRIFRRNREPAKGRLQAWTFAMAPLDTRRDRTTKRE